MAWITQNFLGLAAGGSCHRAFSTPSPGPFPSKLGKGSYNCSYSEQLTQFQQNYRQKSQVESMRDSFPPLLWGD